VAPLLWSGRWAINSAEGAILAGLAAYIGLLVDRAIGEADGDPKRGAGGLFCGADRTARVDLV